MRSGHMKRVFCVKKSVSSVIEDLKMHDEEKMIVMEIKKS
jgi:hypothetical protein